MFSSNTAKPAAAAAEPAAAARPAGSTPPVPPASSRVAGSALAGSFLYAPKWFPSKEAALSVSYYLYYGAVGLFILFLLALAIHFTVYPIFSFSPDDDGLIPLPTASDRQDAFKDVIASPDVSANFINIPPCGYTIAFDTYITGAFQTSSIPRTLLYRSIDTKVTPVATDTDVSGSLLARFPNTNLIAWLDPNHNDLNVSVAVKNPNSNTPASILITAPPIENVPQREPFRTTIVFTPALLEVYLNGELRVTKPFSSLPLQIDSKKNYFFPTVPGIGAGVMTSAYSFWSRPLSSREVRANGDPVASSTLFTAPAR